MQAFTSHPALVARLYLVATIIQRYSGLFINRPAWQQPMVVWVAGLLILLGFTFLFPPFWLRGLLVAGLLAGLVWTMRKPDPLSAQMEQP